jgi:hypothetical protein
MWRVIEPALLRYNVSNEPFEEAISSVNNQQIWKTTFINQPRDAIDNFRKEVLFELNEKFPYSFRSIREPDP